VVGDSFAVSKSTVCQPVHRVTEVTASLHERYAKFPSTGDEQRSTMQLFYNRSKMHSIVNAIDCPHVPIQSPGPHNAMPRSTETTRAFFNKCTIGTQSNCLHIRCSVHDGKFFDNSKPRSMLENQQINGCLVGGGGYACRRYMLTPLNTPTTAA